MDEMKIKTRLIIDEGKKYKVYRDSLNKLTVGIGHLVLEKDGLFEGDVVNDKRIEELYHKDINIAIDTCRKVFINWPFLSSDKQDALINLSFNLGETRLRQFKKFINHINNNRFKNAVLELKFSKWYIQVQRNRSNYIIDTLSKE